MLTKEAILAADDLLREAVEVPEWGGVVYIRTMTGVGRDAFEQAVSDARGTGDRVDIAGLKALLVALTLCGQDGIPLFTAQDAGELNQKSAGVIDRLYQVAAKLNGLRPEDAKELVGN